jgi:hypothetical protein
VPVDTLQPHEDNELAQVQVAHGGDRVRLPPAFAEAALQRFAEWGGRWRRVDGDGFVVVVAHRESSLLLRALEQVKPERLGPDGCPLPWVPPRPHTESLAAAQEDEDDVVALPAGAPLPAGGTAGVAVDVALAALAGELCALAGVPTAALQLVPRADDRRGFCAGRVWVPDEPGRPALIVLRPCPNADAAEIAATLAHEVAHLVARGARHEEGFKRALLELAERRWGAAYFACADVRRPYPDLDRWIATGIRAAGEGRPPPVHRTGDGGDTARVVTRIRKLRLLAADQVGTPEAVTATGVANDLVTTYGLGGYEVQIAGGIDEQMVDRFVAIQPRAVWQRQLAGAVADFFGVFALQMARASRMHFFGRHADVVATAYLVEVCIGKIERARDAWMAEWKRRERPGAGDSRREAVSFCDSAVHAFARKLRDIRAREGEHGADETKRALRAATEFARVEHEKRGLSWGTASARHTRHHAEGAKVGEDLSVVRGAGVDAAARALGRE